MRSPTLAAALVLVASLTGLGCSLIVKPGDAPRLCAGPGVDCGDGYGCVDTGEGFRCVPTCSEDGDCAEITPERPRCGPGGICVECTADAHCADPRFPLCSENVCVAGCRTDEQCTGSLPHCAPDARCVACTESAHCEEGALCVGFVCTPGCDGPDRCPEGDLCVDGVCRTPQEEVCDDLDNDFDGEVDEGFDRDEDGYTTCVNVPPSGDCNDDSNLVSPGRAETCNGVDDDCDGSIDEETCSGGYVCDVSEGRCVPRECEDDEDCFDGQMCVVEVGQCEDRAELGDPCLGDSQCHEGRCLPVAPLGLSGEIPGRCTELCCNEFDCGVDQWCADNGTGLRVCAPRDWFGSVGTSCERPECPACVSSRCRLQCCSDDDCGSGSCQVATARTPAADSATTTVCDARSGGEPSYGYIACDFLSFDYCDSGLAYVYESMILVGDIRCACMRPCCRDEDCTDGGTYPNATCAIWSTGATACWPAGLSLPLEAGGTYTFATATGAGFGGACLEPDDCASRICHPGRYCTRTCCSDSDCGGGYSCRPQSAGSDRFANVCVRDE